MSRQNDYTQNLSHKVYVDLKEKIKTLEYPPNHPLLEVNLCNEFDVSRTPVREAIKQLQRDSFVAFVPGTGNIVAPLSIDGYVEIFQLREALELVAIRLAALNWEDDDIDHLRTNLAKQHQLKTKADYVPDDFLSLDMAFHREMAVISRNTRLVDEIDKLYDLFYRYNYFCDFKTRLFFAISEHDKLLHAVESRNSHLAETYMKDHLSNINSLILVKLASQLNKVNQGDLSLRD